MKKILLFLSFLLMSIGMFGETITFKVYQSGSSSTTYVTTETEQTSGSYNYKMNNWNPSNGQTRGNQSTVYNNFYIYNTSAIPGNITKIQINVKSGTYTYSNKIYYVLSTSSCKSNSGGTTFSSNTANVTGSNTFFCIYFKNGATTGTSCLNSITITYTPTTSYTIADQSNNNTYGTVSLDNKVITATPNTGYRIDDDNPYDISPSGSATIVRGTGANINKFTVTPSANTTVTINFEPIPTHTLTFINTSNPTNIPQSISRIEGTTVNIEDSIVDTNEDCKKNGWEFIGWTDTENGENIITSVTLDEDHNVYALYKLIELSNTYINDTITANDLSATSTQYKDFSNVVKNSGAIYSGNSAKDHGAIQLRSGTTSGSDKHAGIITTTSGGIVDSIIVTWNGNTASSPTDRWLKFYTSDTAFHSPNDMWNYSRADSLKSCTQGSVTCTNRIKLQPAQHIGIRSKDMTLYLDQIIIMWKIIQSIPTYSTNPKCYDAGISIAHWYENSIKFDFNEVGDSTEIVFYNATDTIVKKNWIRESDGSYKIDRNRLDTLKYTNLKLSTFKQNDTVCIRKYSIPIMISTTTNTLCDSGNVAILSGGRLNINKDTVSGDVIIYEGGVLNIQSGKAYSINSLTLRRDNNDIPQFLYEGTLKVNDGMFFELRTDGSDWRWLTLPDSIRISEISDKPEVLLKYYDGGYRAQYGRGGWKFLNKDTISGFGTIFGIDLDTDEKRIYQFKLDTNILSQEKFAHKHINVGKFNSDKPNDVGWNLVGNPFMTTYNVNTDFMNAIKFKTDSLVKEIINGQWTGGWVTIEKDLRYIVVPSDKQEQHIIDAGGYEQICLQNGYKIKPFTSFFIQAHDKGELVFYHGQRVVNAPSRISTTNKNKETFLQINIGSIKTGCYISNKFNDSYEIGDDMESLYSTYQLINGYKLLYSAVNDSIVEHGIKVYTPAGNLHLDDKTNIEDFEEIYAFYNDDWIDLLHGQTQNVSGEFILFAKRKTQVDIPTDISIIKDNNEVIKFMHNNSLYIKKNNHIYNILGGIVK